MDKPKPKPKRSKVEEGQIWLKTEGETEGQPYQVTGVDEYIRLVNLYYAGSVISYPRDMFMERFKLLFDVGEVIGK